MNEKDINKIYNNRFTYKNITNYSNDGNKIAIFDTQNQTIIDFLYEDSTYNIIYESIIKYLSDRRNNIIDEILPTND